MKNILLKATSLRKYYPIKKGIFLNTVGFFRAVDDVSFFIREEKLLIANLKVFKRELILEKRFLMT